MDRTIVYPGAIPLDTDNLAPQRFAEIALGWLTQATMGTDTGVVGLACNPTSPASMTVNVGQGAIWSLGEIDSTDYGSLAADTSPLMKMGINAESAGTNFALTAPGTAGQSIDYLIQASFSETDGTPETLPYLNASNPSQSWSGPNNTGTAQNTQRIQRVSLTLKTGTPATTGSQVAPSADAGAVPLYVVTVANGQTTVTAADIAVASGAPFADFYEPDVSAQIASVIEGAGLTPDRTNTAQLTTAIPLLGRYSFDAGTPPASPISLAVGQRCTITFEGADLSAGMAAHIASLPGLYRVICSTYASNTVNADLDWYPNDTTYPGAFSLYQLGSVSQSVTGFGSATSGPSLTQITQYPYQFTFQIALTGINVGDSSFAMDLFNGPGSADTIDDRGNFSIEILVSTFTTGKHLRWSGGVIGSASTGFGIWNDTTTPWTSLGTFYCRNGTSFSGTMIIERLA